MKTPVTLSVPTFVFMVFSLTGCPEKKPEVEGPATSKPATSAPANAPAPANPPKSGGGW